MRMIPLMSALLVVFCASIALATISADPPGPQNRVQGNAVPDGTYTGKMEGCHDADGAQSGWKLILSADAVDENGAVIDENDDGIADFPAGTVLFFQPTDIEGSTDNKEHGENQANNAVTQGDNNNEVDVTSGDVTGIRTDPPRPVDVDNRGDG